MEFQLFLCLHISWSNRLIWIFTTKEKSNDCLFCHFLFCFVLFFIQLNYSAISVRTHLIPFNFLMIYEQYRVCHFPSSEILVIFIFNFSICLHSLLRSWFGHFVVETFLCDFVKMNEALKYIDNNNNNTVTHPERSRGWLQLSLS